MKSDEAQTLKKRKRWDFERIQTKKGQPRKVSLLCKNLKSLAKYRSIAKI